MKEQANKRVLLLSVIRSDFSKQLKLAFLLRSNSIDVEFYFDQRSHNLEDSINEAKSNGFKVYSSNSFSTNVTRSLKRNNKTAQVNSGIVIFLRGLVKELMFLKRARRNFEKVLYEQKINAVITSINSVGYNIPLYATLCYRNSIPVVCIPFAVSDEDATHKAIQNSKKSSPHYGMNRYWSLVLRSWVLPVNSINYLMLPAELILAFMVMRVKVKYPLSFYGVTVSQLLLENEYMLNLASRQKIAAKNVSVTGGVFDDDLRSYAQYKQEKYSELCGKLNWNSSNKLICLALPPLIKEISSDERFMDLSVLIDRFLPASIDLSNWNVLICLHPRISSSLLTQITFSTNIRWITDPVEKYIPLSDFFISTFSSTIRTSVAFKIPTINYDILNFKYTLFNDLPGIAYTQDENDYEKIMIDFCKGGTIYRTKLNAMSSDNPLSSTFDGNSTQRILTIIQDTFEK